MWPQVVLTSIEPQSRPDLSFDAYEYTVQSHTFDQGERQGGRGLRGRRTALRWAVGLGSAGQALGSRLSSLA